VHPRPTTMKKYLVILLLLSLTPVMHSQDKGLSLGFSSGASVSSVKAINGWPGTFHFQPGFACEFMAKKRLIPNFYFETSLGYLQNGYHRKWEDLINAINFQAETSYAGNKSWVKHSYINNDWLVAYEFGNRVSFRVSLGAYYSFYLRSRNTFMSYIFFDPNEYDDFGDSAFPIGYEEHSETNSGRRDYVNNLDYGLLSNIGIGYALNQKINCTLSSKYYYGLADIDQSDLYSRPPEKYNRSFVIKVGFEVKL
jgi:hypothetical protein